MPFHSEVYRTSLALLTDLYELTMAAAYFKSGLADRESIFHLTFRSNPFQGGFAVCAGLGPALDCLSDLRFDESDLAFLAQQRGADGKPLFDPAFLDRLRSFELSLDIDAIPEGTLVFPHEPLVRVQGRILEAQLIETALLNFINFQTLIATKAARVCLAARGEPVIEFGLRRAQGIDGGLSASRAAYLGGCAGTSNVLAGKLLGIPVGGTHAHSWVMLFEDELEAFRAYAKALPNNCTFLVDTYDSLEGVRHAIEAGRELRANGHELLGIRLDSGDLAYLSIQARRLLDEAGFEKTRILASNDLDETTIDSLKEQGATISTWGVGTRLVTGYDQPALGGIYKLSAVKGADGIFQHKVKLSEQAAKISTPGKLQVRRFNPAAEYAGDMIFDELLPMTGSTLFIDPEDITHRKAIPEGTPYQDLLVPVMRGGKRVGPAPTLLESRARAQEQLGHVHSGIKRFLNPHRYPAGLEKGLHDLKTRLVLEARRLPV